MSGKAGRMVSLTGICEEEHFATFASVWRTGPPETWEFHLGLALRLFSVYFAIYKLKEGIKDENNLYNKNMLNV